MSWYEVKKSEKGYKFLGSLNYETVAHLHRESRALFNEKSVLCFDFSEVTYVDSAAIALMISWLRIAKRNNQSLSFLNLPNQLIEMANMYEVMPLLQLNNQNKKKSDG